MPAVLFIGDCELGEKCDDSSISLKASAIYGDRREIAVAGPL